MATDNEELELAELEDSDAETGDDAADDESSSDTESDRPKNRWASLRDGGIASRFDEKEGDDAASDDESQDDDDDTDTDEEGDGAAGDEESDQDEDPDETDEEQEAGEGDDKKGKSSGKPNAARASRYEIVDTTGQKFAFQLDEGSKIRVKADGAVHEFTDMDSLIASAQKGIHADRALSQAGQERSTLNRQVQQLEQDAEADEDFLIELVTDPAWKELEAKLKAAGVALPEKFRKVQKALDRYADPEFRKGQKAIRDQETTTKRQQSEAVNTFWNAVDQQISRALGSKGYELVDVEDKPEIVQRFYALYDAELAKLEQQFGTSAEGKSRAQREAAKVLNETNLRRVMKTVHDRYAKRLPPGSKPTPKGGKGKESNSGKSAATDERAGKREADRHNQRTKDKLQQRQGSRSLRGGGAAAGNGPRRAAEKPKTFEGKMASAMSRLRKLGERED